MFKVETLSYLHKFVKANIMHIKYMLTYIYYICIYIAIFCILRKLCFTNELRLHNIFPDNRFFHDNLVAYITKSNWTI